MAKSALRKSAILLAGAGLLAISACTQMGYVKAGVTDEEYAQDSQDCAEIARHQAFRDQAVYETRFRHDPAFRHDDRFWSLQDFGPTMPELQFRYQRICMLSRGYELAPLVPEDKPQ
jgi:hypothetical protein